MNWVKLKNSFWEAFKYGIIAVIAGVIAGVISTGMKSNYPAFLWMSYVIILMFFGIGGLTVVIYTIPNRSSKSPHDEPKKDSDKDNIKKEFSHILRNFYLNIIAIFVFSAFIGYLLSFFFVFSQETLLWTTSTIIQGFGAMVAIIIAIALYQLGLIGEVFRRRFDARRDAEILETYKNEQEYLSWLHGQINQQRSKLRLSLIPPIMSIAFLLIVSLLVLLFTNSSLKISYPGDVNITLAIAMTFLIFYSVYCLVLLVLEITNLLKKM